MAIDFHGADLSGKDLRGAKLEGAKLEGAKLEGANLAEDSKESQLYKREEMKDYIRVIGMAASLVVIYWSVISLFLITP